VQNLMTNRIKS